MKKTEILKVGFNELKSNKLRTSLTMLGIVFGVAAVIAMLSIGEGAKQETIEQIELLGTNNIIIKKVILKNTTGKEKKKSFSPGLSTKDGDAITEINPFVKVVVPQREIKCQLIYKSNILEARIIGSTENYLQVQNSKISSGRFFNKYELNYCANVCVIGSGIKEQVFRFEDAVNKKIKISDQWFTILGVVASKKISAGTEEMDIRNFNEDIYVPLSTMAYKMEKLEEQPENGGFFWYFSDGNQLQPVVDKTSVDQLLIKVNNSDDIKEAASLTSRILQRRHYNVPDYEIILPEELLAQKQKTQKIFNIVMGAIAGISLLVGGIGIMNIMLANILERTKEIGVRRALGATKKDLLNQFIYEALIISVTGGLLGIALGFILTSAITSYAEWRTIITPFSVILAFFVSAGVGLGFGIYPAKIAADKDPIEALRYE